MKMRRKPPYVCVCGESFTNMEDLTHHKEWACDRILKQRKKIDQNLINPSRVQKWKKGISQQNLKENYPIQQIGIVRNVDIEILVNTMQSFKNYE